MCNKIRLLAALVLALSLMLTACKGGGEKPEESLFNTLNAIRDWEEETLQKYYPSADELLNSGDKMLGINDTARIILGKMSFNIVSCTKSGNTATVKTEITNVDMGAVIEEFFSQVMAMALSADDTQEKSSDEQAEELKQILLELIKSEDAHTKTTELDIKMTKSGDIWQINESDEFVDALTGGLFSTADSFLGGIG